MLGVVFDTEGDSLYPSKFHVLSYTDGSSTVSVTSSEEMRQFLLTTPIIVGHNIARWDIPNLERVLEIKIPKETIVIDTLAVSWYINYDRGVHKLESFGETFGVKKPKIDDWEGLSIEAYKHRCETDVLINKILWDDLYKKLIEIYRDDDGVLRICKYLSFKMYCARLQEESKFRLDVEKTKENLQLLYKEKDIRTEELVQNLPRVPKFSLRTRPKVYKTKSGELSKAARDWEELCKVHGVEPESCEDIEVRTGDVEGNPQSHQQIKDWLFGLGWTPKTFKENDKKEQVPQINRPKQEGGGLCPSVLELAEEHPEVKALDKFFVVNHRISILEGFLRNQRGGFLQAKIAGLTNTLRFKHEELVNLPKIDAEYGGLIRSVLIAEDDEHEICGADQSSLEDRIKQHYCFKYDPEYVNEMKHPDFDPHLDLAKFAGALSNEDIKKYHSKIEIDRIKPIRSIYKNGNYA